MCRHVYRRVYVHVHRRVQELGNGIKPLEPGLQCSGTNEIPATFFENGAWMSRKEPKPNREFCASVVLPLQRSVGICIQTVVAARHAGTEAVLAPEAVMMAPK